MKRTANINRILFIAAVKKRKYTRPSQAPTAFIVICDRSQIWTCVQTAFAERVYAFVEVKGLTYLFSDLAGDLPRDALMKSLINKRSMLVGNAGMPLTRDEIRLRDCKAGRFRDDSPGMAHARNCIPEININ